MNADLIARLEKAEVGSRDLDADISIAVFDSQVKRERQILQSFVHHMGDGEWTPIPEYTTSLDAIVELIGEKLPGWTIASIGMADDRTWHCELRRGFTTSYDAIATSSYRPGSRPKTAAVSCCIALLKALEAQHER